MSARVSGGRPLSDLVSLRGRVALITGGASSIGRAIADTFAELGAAIAVLDRPGSGADAVAGRITDNYGVLTTVLSVDLADEALVRKVPQRVVDSCGRLDILVHTAFFEGNEATIDAWRKTLEAHLTAPFLLVQQAIPALKASGKGSIINVAPNGHIDAHEVTKGGLLHMTQSLATTLAPHVRVNAIVSGNMDPGVEAFTGVAAFLASDLSAQVTGQCIAVGRPIG
jgi:NAD(P)-dependent dehydrogenase (short-subunit alcohol dehydrogenase family)